MEEIVPSAAEADELNTYYGVNVSPSLQYEPLDQVDGFLVAKACQQLWPGRFFPFIAGSYGMLNAKDTKEAATLSATKLQMESRKKQFYQTLMNRIGLEGEVLTTFDLWNREDYWNIFSEVIGNLDRSNLEKTQPVNGVLRMKDFPKQYLGIMRECVPDSLTDGWQSTTIYIPAEVAETIWFQRILRISYKIGPRDKERIYDDISIGYGIGIIGMDQPRIVQRDIGRDSSYNGSELKAVAPYIGKSSQNRIFFSDNLGDIAMKRDTLSFERARQLADTYAFLSGESRGNDTEQIYALARMGGLR